METIYIFERRKIMFKKVKKFYEEHKIIVLSVGGSIVILTAGVLLGKKIKSKTLPKIIENLGYDDSKDRAILESYGAIFKDGIDVPFATKEIAIKFLEDRGDTYQIDILDDLTSVIWISKK
jgi:putative intracellular protease/amidase